MNAPPTAGALPAPAAAETGADGRAGLHECGPGLAADPTAVPNWDQLLEACPEGCFFCGSWWVRVLRETYGHRPAFFCQLEHGRLEGLLPFMEVSSRLTGRRGVSLPFADACLPLRPGNGSSGLGELYVKALEHGRARGWQYLERRGSSGWAGASPSMSYYGHVVELERGREGLWRGFAGNVRQNIRKAEAAGLRVDFEEDLPAVRTFYALHCKTRRRHGVPPQPFRFFENIARHILAKGHGCVAIARLADRPVAAAVYFHHGRRALYKFGASDYAWQHLRPNQLVMWAALRRYADAGYASLHLGRTSLANEGLRRFKRGFAAREEKLEYFKYDFREGAFVTDRDRAEGGVTALLRYLPISVLRLAGSLLYPHLS